MVCVKSSCVIKLCWTAAKVSSSLPDQLQIYRGNRAATQKQGAHFIALGYWQD